MEGLEVQSKGQAQRLRPLGYGLIILLAVLPSWGTLNAPFLAEDASILGRMSSMGALDDWFQAQYGIEHVVRFWRPLVSCAWWLQFQLSGTEAWPARLAGLLVHALSALVLGRLLLDLGVQRSGALLGAALAAVFVHQGGTITWLAGRTDLMVGFGMLLALWSAIKERPLSSAVFALLACACKEFAFLLPLWVGVILWARGLPWSRWLRVCLPVLGACILAYVWRTLALGVWDGGYAGGGSSFAQQVLPGLLHLARNLTPLLGACSLLCLFGWWRGSLHARLALAGLICALGAALPIVPLAAAQRLEPSNERLLLVVSLGLAISAAAAFARPAPQARSNGPALLLILPLLGSNAWQAFEDTHQWARAADLAAQHEARARALVAGLSASDRPVLVAGIPTNTDGAYCLGLGLSDRFRAPFEPTPRPVWPLRPIFEVGLLEREMVRELVNGELLLPFEGAPRVPMLELIYSKQDAQPWLSFDQRVMPAPEDSSPIISLGIPQLTQPARLEVLVYTELGYGSIQMPAVISEPGIMKISLRALVSTSDGGHDLAQMLVHAADLGQARRAYLELRLVDEAGLMLAATPWIETRWGPGFLASIGS